MSEGILKSGRLYLKEEDMVFLRKNAIDKAIALTLKDSEYNYRLPTEKEFMEDYEELPLKMRNKENEIREDYFTSYKEEEGKSIYFINQFNSDFRIPSSIIFDKENESNMPNNGNNSSKGSFVLIKEKYTEYTEKELFFNFTVSSSSDKKLISLDREPFSNLKLTLDTLIVENKFSLFTEDISFVNFSKTEKDNKFFYNISLFLKNESYIEIESYINIEEKAYSLNSFKEKEKTIKKKFMSILNISKRKEIY